MTGLHTALAALVEKWKTEAAHPNGQPLLCQVYGNLAREAEALLAKYEPTPSDQALRDLRAGLEAAIERARQVEAAVARTFHRPIDPTAVRVPADHLADLLASSAPATASEGTKCSHCGNLLPHAGTSWKESSACRRSESATGVTSSNAATDPPPDLQVATDAATPVTSPDEDRPRLCCPSMIGTPHDQDCEHHETTPPASSDGDRGLSEEERELRGALCPYCGHRAIWHHDTRGCGYLGNGADQCPCACDSDMVVERIIAARVDGAVGAALIVGATRTQPEITERVEWDATDRTTVELGQHLDWAGTVRPSRDEAIADFVHDGDDVLIRRAVGPWEPVEDTTGGDDRG